MAKKAKTRRIKWFKRGKTDDDPNQLCPFFITNASGRIVNDGQKC